VIWRLYAIGFAAMAALMLVAGGTLFFVTLAGPPTDSTPEADWLIRASVAVALGVLAAGLSTLAWRQSRRPAA
jgi:hypothetical protein